MKVWPSRKKVIWLGIAIFLFSAVLVFASCISIFLSKNWDYRQWLIIGVFLGMSIVIFILTISTYFYVIEKDQLVVVKFRRGLFYPYSDILYIEQNPNKKEATITIVMKSGQSIYLIPDKVNKLFEALEKNCKNLMSKEDVKNRFPRIKL
ncbi:MAG TPA: hypothetical protein PLY58_02585 [Bacilli bacterium]|nr:hypothetical protein [Bacilli bacterium]HQA55944.1 hypothetical protein [Bacilli bacterium]